MYAHLNKAALLDVEFGANGRSKIYTTLHSERLRCEVCGISGDSSGGGGKSRRRGGKASVVVEKHVRVVSRLRRKTSQCNGNEAEEDRVYAQVPAEKDPASSNSEETLHDTDSEFVPSTGELQSNENTSCTSNSVSCTCTENWDAERLAEYASVEDATVDGENVIAYQVQY